MTISDTLSRLTLLLRNNREELIRDWIARVRSDGKLWRAHDLTEVELRDYVPKLLEDLVDSLAKGTVSSAAEGPEIGASESAKKHVRHRFEQKYELADVLRELGLIRAAIIDLATREGVVLAGYEAQLVHSAIDEVMITAACEMAEITSADLRRDVALRDMLAAVLGHDLRTPIAAIQLTISNLLKREDVPASLLRYHQRVGRAADRMQRMVVDLLDMTRIRIHGGLPVRREPGDLRSICEHMLGELGLRYPDRTIEFQSRGDAQGHFDADRMAQVLSNLVGNALDYSPPDAPVRVRVRGENGNVVLEVNNQGAPMSPETLASAFEPFRRGSDKAFPVRPQPQEGLGLGLFIVSEIVKAHGGTVRVSSDAQSGTTFTLTLPRHP
jgi:signal transduction histidine kinase